jgi:hypothetical protein
MTLNEPTGTIRSLDEALFVPAWRVVSLDMRIVQTVKLSALLLPQGIRLEKVIVAR